MTWRKSWGRAAAVTYDDIVEEALAFGWIDSKPGKVDDERTRLVVTPRKRGSNWSAPNKRRVAKMTRAKRMAKAGLAVVEQAKADGSWSRLDQVDRLIVPGRPGRRLRPPPRIA